MQYQYHYVSCPSFSRNLMKTMKRQVSTKLKIPGPKLPRVLSKGADSVANIIDLGQQVNTAREQVNRSTKKSSKGLLNRWWRVGTIFAPEFIKTTLIGTVLFSSYEYLEERRMFLGWRAFGISMEGFVSGNFLRVCDAGHSAG